MSALIANPAVRSLLRGVLVWAPLWIFSTLLFGGLGLGYVVFLKQDTFLASQALLVRDEATGAVMRLGRFQSQAEMKAAQETILEMSKSQQVVRDALVAVGPLKSLLNWMGSGEYPTKELVEEVAKSSISVHAPKGTEFGVTEVIYMDVKADAKDEAMLLSTALTDALEARLQQVRKARADGVLAELTHARNSAKRELSISTDRLHAIESEAGSDLSDLRGMTDTVAGAATSRAEFDQVKNDLRQAEVSRQALIADRELLVRATKDPSAFIVAPGSILNSQPGLKRLREGLVDAQLSGSQLTGKFMNIHPAVIASQSTMSSISKRFLSELRASIAGVESDISLVDGRIQRLEAQKELAEVRLAKLADSRSNYANLLSEVKSKIAILDASEKALAEVQAARDSSVSTSLLTRLDAPMVSDRPIGPGKTTISAMCAIAGLVFGLGIVFVVTPIDAGPVFGRRSLDRSIGRRDVDLTPQVDNSEVLPTIVTPAIVPPAESQPTEAASPAANKPFSDEPKKLQLPAKLNMRSNVPVTPSQGAMPEGYQALTTPRPSASALLSKDSIAGAVPKKESDLSDVDKAFQELARIKARKPESRSEELALQMKVQELKGFLSSQSNRDVRNEKNPGEELSLTKPRRSNPN